MPVPKTAISAVAVSVRAALLILLASCNGAETEAFGAAAEALGGYCIRNVFIDPATVHFRGQEWQIGSAEGCGPRDLEVNVAEFLQPQVSSSTDVKPGADDISHAVGYSMTARYQVSASSRITVDTGRCQRVEAYTSYQRAIWEIRDAACGATLGMGASYKPVGVYFRTTPADNLGICDPGLYVPPPVCVGVDCGPGAPEPEDAGAPDSG